MTRASCNKSKGILAWPEGDSMAQDRETLALAGQLDQLIYNVRDQKIMLDADLADVYGVETKRLNEQVKRNTDRFPPDFMFQLTTAEADAVWRSRSQNTTLQGLPPGMRSQIATASKRNVRFLPYAFTEHGAIVDILRRVMDIIDPPALPEPPRKQIGFPVKENRAVYRTNGKRGKR